MKLTRRKLIVGGVLGGGALLVGWWFAKDRDRLGDRTVFKARMGEVALNGWVKVGRDGSITVAAPRAEMGQGIHSALAALVAEEMDAKWSDVRVEDAADLNVYRNVEILIDGLPFSPEETGRMIDVAKWAGSRVSGLLGVVATGGSTSVRDAWEPMRLAGASARDLLLRAAAAKAGVDRKTLTVVESEVRDAAGKKIATYGELAATLGALQPLRDVPVKKAGEFRLIGKPLPRIDVPAKVMGTAGYGTDVRLPDMLYAAIANCPTFGGKTKGFSLPSAGLPKGIVKVIELPTAIAVVADSWWRANKFLTGGDLRLNWDAGPNAGLDSRAIAADYAGLLKDGKPKLTRSRGADTPPADAKFLPATYTAPYLAHATMEPMNCTSLLDRGALTIWMPNQSSSLMRYVGAKEAGLDQDKVTVHTTYLGGGFGRRAEVDLVRQAVALAKALPGKPIQVLWSREEDIQHDFYRPMATARFVADIPADPKALPGWTVRLVGQSASSQFPGRVLGIGETGDPDGNSVENPPYAFARYRLDAIVPQGPVPVGFWRSVGHSHTAFFDECFLDEVAIAMGRDPLELRRALLKDKPRHLAVLDAVAKASGWGTPLPAATGRGIALRASFGSIVAQVAEVAVEGRTIRVRKVFCAIGCGIVVNPAIVRAQMESGIVYGLSAALHGRITIKGGAVEQANFPDYDAVRMADMPAVETILVESKDAPLGGVGEPGTPPIAPAVGNAIFAATGKRLRNLPFELK